MNILSTVFAFIGACVALLMITAALGFPPSVAWCEQAATCWMESTP